MLKSCLLALLACFLSSVVHGQELIKASDPESIVTVFQELGYRAKLEKDSQGDPVIRSTFSGTGASVYFYSCTDGADCGVIQFVSGFDKKDGISQEVLNTWNRKKLFGRTYRDDEDDPWLKMSINLDGGVTKENFVDTIEWWEVVVDQFKEHIDF